MIKHSAYTMISKIIRFLYRTAFVIFILVIFAGSLFALNTSSLIAYPVPFNPRKGGVKYITIGNAPSVSPLNVDRFVIEVFDINGDPVTRKESTASEVRWNGRNDKGKLVKPGLYLIRVTVENTSTGDFGKKLLRILVNY